MGNNPGAKKSYGQNEAKDQPHKPREEVNQNLKPNRNPEMK